MTSPVCGSRTAARTSFGYRRWAVFDRVSCSPATSISRKIESCVDSWVMVQSLLRVFIAGGMDGSNSLMNASVCSRGDGVTACTLGDGVAVCTLGDGVVSCTLGDSASFGAVLVMFSSSSSSLLSSSS